MSARGSEPMDRSEPRPPPQEGAEGEDFGYRLFPERRSEAKPQRSFLATSLLTFNHKCQVMLKIALNTSPYAQLLLDAMKQSGCTVHEDRHFACEDCDGCVSGGFDSATSQVCNSQHGFVKNKPRQTNLIAFFDRIVLCQNNIHQQSHMNRVVTHELIHAFDHCRAHVDWFSNVKHLACSEIRAANLSGDCSLINEMTRFKFGLKQHHQTCVRDRAIRSILAVRKVSKETAEKAVDGVFDSCFNDHEPFGRVPHSKSDAKYAYRNFQNRDRYYANL